MVDTSSLKKITFRFRHYMYAFSADGKKEIIDFDNNHVANNAKNYNSFGLIICKKLDIFSKPRLSMVYHGLKSVPYKFS